MQDIGEPWKDAGGRQRDGRRGRPRGGALSQSRRRVAALGRVAREVAALGRHGRNYATICVAARRRPELHPSFALTAGTPWAI